jgi:maltose O-acetyltransferase
MRASVLRLMGAEIGQDCSFRSGLDILESFNLTVGNTVFINVNCTIDCAEKVTIGDNVCLGYNVTLSTGDHLIGGPEKRCGDGAPKPITVENGVWIGAGATIFSGVKLGEGCVVMGGSVVGSDVQPHTMVGGNPARPIKKIEVPSQAVD